MLIYFDGAETKDTTTTTTKELARIIETVRTKCIIFGEALKVRGQKYEQTLLENCSINAKIVITACKISKIFRGSMPRPRLKLFLLLKINSAGKNFA